MAQFEKEKGKLTPAMLSQLLQFQSPIYYVLTKEAWLWRGWGTGGGTPYPLRDEKFCLHHWFVAWKTVIRWCWALKTIRKLAFLVITKPKDASCSWIYPRQYIYRKKLSHYFFSSYPIYVCNSSTFEIRLINQPRILSEWHQETDANDSLILRD